jgi:hypothetical protein
LLKLPLSAGTEAPMTIDGDYVTTGAGIPNSNTQQPLIIAYKLGASSKVPDTVRWLKLCSWPTRCAPMADQLCTVHAGQA